MHMGSESNYFLLQPNIMKKVNHDTRATVKEETPSVPAKPNERKMHFPITDIEVRLTGVQEV